MGWWVLHWQLPTAANTVGLPFVALAPDLSVLLSTLMVFRTIRFNNNLQYKNQLRFMIALAIFCPQLHVPMDSSSWRTPLPV